MWLILALGSALFAGITAILAKAGLQDTDSHLATALRTGVVLVFSWLIVFLTGTQAQLLAMGGTTWISLVLSGLATGGSWLCYFRALQLGDVHKVAAVDKSSTVLTMLLAFLVLQEPLTWMKAAGMGAIVGGTWLMVYHPGADRPEKGRKYGWLPWAFGSALCASLAALLSKWGMQGISSHLGTAIRTAVVLVMAWGVVFLLRRQGQVRRLSGKNWCFLLLSGIATGLSWLCYFRALQTGPMSVVVPVDKLSILVTVVLSRLLFRERLSWRGWLGLGIMTAGTLCLLW